MQRLWQGAIWLALILLLGVRDVRFQDKSVAIDLYFGLRVFT